MSTENRGLHRTALPKPLDHSLGTEQLPGASYQGNHQLLTVPRRDRKWHCAVPQGRCSGSPQPQKPCSEALGQTPPTGCCTPPGLIHTKCDPITQMERLALAGAQVMMIRGSFLQDNPFITFCDSFVRLMSPPPQGVIKQVKLNYFPPAASWRESPSVTDEARCLHQIGPA